MSQRVPVMPLRQSVRAGSGARLCRLCELRAFADSPRKAAPSRTCRAAAIRHFTTPSRAWSQAFPSDELTASSANQPPHSYSKELQDLLKALQAQNFMAIFRTMLRWARLLEDPESQEAQWTAAEIKRLPAPTFSELLRSLDPGLLVRHDASSRIRISYGEKIYTGNGTLVDDFGVRVERVEMMKALFAVVSVRASARKLQARDFEILMRWSGSAYNWQASKDAWTYVVRSAPPYMRTIRSSTEFLKARFATDPLNYQHDRSRVALRVRDAVRNKIDAGPKTPRPAFLHSRRRLGRLDNLEYSLNSLKREPWNRMRNKVHEDMRRFFRRRSAADYRAFRVHWLRVIFKGDEVDEDFLCTAIVALARSLSMKHIRETIFGTFYGVYFVETANGTEITGGFNLGPESLIRPTPRLLNAIVDAYGSVSQIPLCLKVLTFFSQRYHVPIPAETWSNLLAWTYVSASKPFSTGRKIRGRHFNTLTLPQDVLGVWDAMKACGIEPTIEDYVLHVKSLIVTRQFVKAAQVLRDDVVPLYKTFTEDYFRAVIDEIVRNDEGPDEDATDARRRAEIVKDHARFIINSCVHALVKSIKGRFRCDEDLTARFLPDLVLEFGEFLEKRFTYNITDGRVDLDRGSNAVRRHWVDHTRHGWRTLPLQRSGAEVSEEHRRDLLPADSWPRLPELNVHAPVRTPVLRWNITRAPSAENKEKYRGFLRQMKGNMGL